MGRLPLVRDGSARFGTKIRTRDAEERISLKSIRKKVRFPLLLGWDRFRNGRRARAVKKDWRAPGVGEGRRKQKGDPYRDNKKGS